VNNSRRRKILHADKKRVRTERRKLRTPSRREGKKKLKNKKVLPLSVWPEKPARVHGLKVAAIQIPKLFSLIENPDESLSRLTILRRCLAVDSIQEIILEYSHCEKLDLCASVVQDVLALRGVRQARFRGKKLSFSGRYTGRPEIDLMLVSSGILKHFKHPVSENIPKEIMERLRFSDLRIGTPSPPKLTSQTELAATALAEFFDDCLRSENHSLKPIWKSNLIQLITEVLDNAEEHAGGQRLWHTIGYYNKHIDAEEGGECHIVLFNFGKTIYESLDSPDTSEELKKQIRELANEHKRRGYFAIIGENLGIIGNIWREESLWTLYALQEGVSRFRNRPGGIDRGNGTVKMIEFFTDLASGNPQMALLSGRTHILFDGKYKISTINVDGESRKIIAFNESNDLRERPDPKYVRGLRNHFPGTLVSLRFQIKKTDLAHIKEKLDTNE